MPDIPESLQPTEKPSKDQGDLIQWHTVSYRVQVSYILGILILAGGILLGFPAIGHRGHDLGIGCG